ncbi:MAG: hypothetical protein C5B54_01990 [Acidobacteria bacterium]|nr:MAG: hypothetical protein C5B54_01990 [Acidobacteriota bacterium]
MIAYLRWSFSFFWRVFTMKWFYLFIFLSATLFAEDQVTNQPEFEKDDSHNFIALGPVTRDQILTLNVFKQRMSKYEPSSSAIQEIQTYPQPVEIKVVFGDWCKDSKQHVPAFMKVMDTAANPNIKISYINVDREKKEPASFVIPLKIQNVPTFIVLSGNQEKGRIVETPKTTVEQDLADILMGVSTESPY